MEMFGIKRDKAKSHPKNPVYVNGVFETVSKTCSFKAFLKNRVELSQLLIRTPQVMAEGGSEGWG